MFILQTIEAKLKLCMKLTANVNICIESLYYRRYSMCYVVLPVYSVFDVTEDVVDPFSQSFSPFLLLERLGDRKPSAESGLKHTHTHTHAHKYTHKQSIRSLFCMGAAPEHSANDTVGRAGNYCTIIQAS